MPKMGEAGSKSNQTCEASDGLAALMGVLADPQIRSRLDRVAKKLAAIQRRGDERREPKSQRQRPRRPGWVQAAIVKVLTEHAAPMVVKNIHVAVEVLIGEPVSKASIKSALYAGVGGPAPKLVRVSLGRYGLAVEPDA